ncbi:MAG: rod shape-determining protein MreC [Bacillota bacterium]
MTQKYKIIRNIILIIALLVVLLTSARMTGIERAGLTPLEALVKNAAAPLQNGATGAIQKVKDFFGMFAEINALREENAQLIKKISELNNEINSLRDYGLENIRLRSLLEYKQAHADDFKLLASQVIARDHSNWYSTITINRGTNDGVKKDMAVVTHQGLVGRIINVTSEASEVLLILDQEGAVGGRVWATRETPGVVEGTGDGSSHLRMIHLPHDVNIKIGDIIVTSGLGGLFPPEIRIGEVIEVKDDVSGLMKQTIIKPFVNFARLEEVFVILEINEGYRIQEELKMQTEGGVEQ